LYLIGLTGNIGTGKSTVLRMLEQLGARVIDADRLAHEVMEPDTPVWRDVVESFGPGVVAADGRIDRAALARIVFDDPVALQRLEAIVHPAVGARIAQALAEATEPVVVIEAIKLIEAGLHERADAVWIVTCRSEQQVQRLTEGRGFSEEEVRRRMEVQPPIEPKLPLADVVIDNSGTVEKTWQQVLAAWQEIEVILRETVHQH